MPTADDLAKLASQLYKGNPSIGAYPYQVVHYLQWDQDAATALGFTSSDFTLWSGEESSSLHAYYRYFDSTYSIYSDNYRFYSGIQTVCLGE